MAAVEEEIFSDIILGRVGVKMKIVLRKYFWLFIPVTMVTLLTALYLTTGYWIFLVGDLVSSLTGVVLGIGAIVWGFRRRKDVIALGFMCAILSGLPVAIVIYFFLAASSSQSLVPSVGDCWGYGYTESLEYPLMKEAYQQWGSGKYQEVIDLMQQIIERNRTEALAMQNSLTEYPLDKDKVFSYKALNLTASALFWLGSAYLEMGQVEQAQETLSSLVDEFYFGQCWCLHGGFAKPALEARELLDQIKAGQFVPVNKRR